MDIRSVRLTVSQALTCVTAIGVVLGLLVVSIRRGEQYTWSLGMQDSCQSNLNNIGLALMNYKEVLGTFPPPFSTNSVGERTQSWRATILPWFPFDFPLQAEYRYSEPWDSKTNSKFLQEAPAFYRCPSFVEPEELNKVSYFMINNFTNKIRSNVPGNAVLVIESNHVDVCWSDPHDDVDLHSQSNAQPVAGNHPDGFGVVLCDYTRFRIKNLGQIKKQGDYYVVKN